ncbi:hypothetical protein HP467_07395 [Curtobacterium albidum]|uniref:Uncharacterized protein n=1 Tax=Curtobacterium citreum TaxID=2036 RepID=A0A850DTY4_9MICO|nr:hypothetical protein [Curtobacterium albidum]NUU27935.1 hypothetical protein [Curtobacterium albidum]
MAKTRFINGQTDVPGHGRVHWTAQQNLQADGKPYVTMLRDATLTNGSRLDDEGRELLVRLEGFSA